MPHNLQNPKWPTESRKVSTPRFWGVLSNFRKISFLIRALLLWEKVTAESGEEKTDGNSGHYVITSSRLPKRWPLKRRTLVPIVAKLSFNLNWDEKWDEVFSVNPATPPEQVRNGLLNEVESRTKDTGYLRVRFEHKTAFERYLVV